MTALPVTGPSRQLTRRQQAILEFLAAWEASPEGYHPPSFREVGRGLSWLTGGKAISTSVVRYLLDDLRSLDLITIEPATARTVRVTKKERNARHYPES